MPQTRNPGPIARLSVRLNLRSSCETWRLAATKLVRACVCKPYKWRRYRVRTRRRTRTHIAAAPLNCVTVKEMLLPPSERRRSLINDLSAFKKDCGSVGRSTMLSLNNSVSDDSSRKHKTDVTVLTVAVMLIIMCVTLYCAYILLSCCIASSLLP